MVVAIALGEVLGWIGAPGRSEALTGAHVVERNA
jgi:hypothetical protein